MERIFFIVRADVKKWKGRWYGLLKGGWGDERRYDNAVLKIKERTIPRANQRMECYVKGLDPCNLEPVEQVNPPKPTQGKTPYSGAVRGPGLPQGSSHPGKGRERSRSRSKSADRNYIAGDIAGLKAIYGSQSFDLLRSPRESEQRIRASSPASKLREYQLRDEHSRPQVEKLYGVSKRVQKALGDQEALSKASHEGSVPPNTDGSPSGTENKDEI
jgi:hypothetical protein